MNRRQKKKWNKKWNENHVTLIDRITGEKTVIKIDDLLKLFDIAGFSKDEIYEWINRSKKEEEI